jgi:hypothetical protein
VNTKKRLHLSRFSVKSFITSLSLADEETEKIKGGDSDNCPTSVIPCPQPTVSPAVTCVCATTGERGVDILG